MAYKYPLFVKNTQSSLYKSYLHVTSIFTHQVKAHIPVSLRFFTHGYLDIGEIGVSAVGAKKRRLLPLVKSRSEPIIVFEAAAKVKNPV